jgi:predicted amidohydrolase
MGRVYRRQAIPGEIQEQFIAKSREVALSETGKFSSYFVVEIGGLETRAFENLVGVAMVNYPAPVHNGKSRAYTCVAWRDGKAQDSLVGTAGEHEEVLVIEFNVGEIRESSRAESWRVECRRGATRMPSLMA